MPKTKSKSTKRFNFEISRNDTSHQAGSNSVTISTNPSSDRYSTGISTMRMTVKEARALNLFLTNELAQPSSADLDFSDPNDSIVVS
tara:strand:- start:693 stop:953 length:261 start_codon:yes stop_codon:yes gene_type:complete